MQPGLISLSFTSLYLRIESMPRADVSIYAGALVSASLCNYTGKTLVGKGDLRAIGYGVDLTLKCKLAFRLPLPSKCSMHMPSVHEWPFDILSLVL